MPSIAEVYRKQEPERIHYEERAWKCAAVTIAHLYPRPGENASTDFPAPFQSNGAHGVNNLAASMQLGLLPPGSPFFRLTLSPALQQEVRELDAQQGGDTVMAQVQETLARWETTIMQEVERSDIRSQVYQMARLLLVTGNVLVEFQDSGKIRLHKLHSYIVERNPDDTVHRIILRELKRKDQIEPDLLDFVGDRDGFQPGGDDKVELFTQITFEDGRYRILQQLGAVVLDGEERVGDEADVPFLPLRFSRTDGEHYGRGLCEEYYGDLRSLEALRQAIHDVSVMSAKVLFLIRPGAPMSPRSLASAPNGAFRSGSAEDVTTLQVGKQADMSVAWQMHQDLQQQVDKTFVVPRVRDKERVTAEEIRFVQDQLERVQGGVFSLLAQEFQAPLVRSTMRRLSRVEGLPALPKGGIQPLIVTGVHALGRSMEAVKLAEFIAEASAALGPQVTAQYINPTEVLSRMAAARAIEKDGLVRSQEEIAQMQAAAMQQQLGVAAAQEGVKRVGAVAEHNLTQEQPAEAA